ncbi:Uncharacterized protein DAT39_003151 [Clarias magur]|uniref:Uncharacterized protein n=1 Tax=Clarias magur TaxID=1594786 RepID=A0A8J4UZL3_CLAMG|nr:Uncharacterized protein DAT39_003151 [Clarias magur]
MNGLFVEEHDPQSFARTSPVPVLPISITTVLDSVVIYLESGCELQTNLTFDCSPVSGLKSIQRWK